MAGLQDQIAQGYREKSEKDAAEKARVDSALKGIAVAGKGAMTFDEIDAWLAKNPDAKYFRIDNGGGVFGNEARSYQGKYGTWTDNDAAIVGSQYDQRHRDVHRYANISAADPRTGKRGEKPTIQGQYEPGSFFKENNINYNASMGMIYSRDEYGSLKNWASGIAGPNGFLSQPTQNRGQRIDYTGAGNRQSQAIDAVDPQRAAGVGSNAADLQSVAEDNLNRRTLLG